SNKPPNPEPAAAPALPRQPAEGHMKLSSHSRQDFFEINVISLIDVLLTLLMFFVLTTTFVQQTHMNITLPEASSSDRADSPHTLVVGVDREGQYFVGNT